MNTDFLKAIGQISSEKGVPAESILKAIEGSLVSAYRRNFGTTNPKVAVRIDRESGEVRVYTDKVVVAEVRDPQTEVSLGEALRVDPDANLGRQVEVDNTPPNFGRIAAQTARQVVLQRLRDLERDQIFSVYADREGDILTGLIDRLENKTAYITLDKTEAVLPPAEQVATESYRPNQRLRVYLVEVTRTPKGPQLLVSRTHRNLVRRLFELEIPEVYNGIVEIKSIAREPGSRTKVAVHARQEGVDPVGSCVGPRHVRIDAVTSELNGEKIDVIPWHPDPAIFVANALSPAKTLDVELTEQSKTATVIVPDRQLSLAIGRAGQNARLAAKLTGWRIDIKPASSRGLEDGDAAEALASANGAVDG
ncbi:MAG TPA: transcription termination factor NusA [Chloroflexota bacterium]|jgi:N utilization substance protein A